jgi:hypothetical protein
VRIGEARRVLQALIAEPKQVQAHLVALQDLVVAEGAPAALGIRFRPGRLALLARPRAERRYELVQVAPNQPPGLRGVVLVGA